MNTSRCLALLGLAAATFWASAAEGPVEAVSVRAVARFGFDRDGLLPADQARLLAEVSKMKDVTWQSVRATGHTDSVGPVAYNQRLSERRADAVKRYLVSQGLAPGMIAVEGKAAEAPAAPNETPEGRAENRRAEVEFQGVRMAVSQAAPPVRQ
jgi:OmpA-OmpF porin, OOP family